MTLSSSTGASRPRVSVSSGERICVPKILNLLGQINPILALTGCAGLS
jgi:hypothetical protein